MNILAIGAHPDDIEIGCGGALIKYKNQGHDIYVLIMTKGDLGGPAKVREMEQMKSAEILGVEKVFWGRYSDTNIRLDKDLIIAIEDILNQVNPDFIFVNYFDDTHQDHRILAKGAISATRYIRNVLFYEVPTTQNIIPNVFIDIDTVLEKKITCLKAHASQMDKTNIKDLNILDIVRSSAIFRGIQGRVKHAEGFVSLRLFINI